MSYEPTNWQAGDTVTSAKLNKMEQGIANSGIKIIHLVETEEIDSISGEYVSRLDITPNELEEALSNGQVPMLLLQTNEDSMSFNKYIILTCYEIDEEYTYICTFDTTYNFISINSNEYFTQSREPK